MLPIILSPVLDALIKCDIAIFYLVNNGTHNRLFDIVMPFLTDIDNWRIPLAVVWVCLIIFGGKRGITAALLVCICLVVTDQLSSNLLKPFFSRTRPCNILDNVRCLVNCTYAYSFPSSHATNIFAQATLFSHKYRRLTPILILIAVFVGFSRVYVGVHFPLDVIFGAFIGFVSVVIILLVENFISKPIKKIWPVDDMREKLLIFGLGFILFWTPIGIIITILYWPAGIIQFVPILLCVVTFFIRRPEMGIVLGGILVLEAILTLLGAVLMAVGVMKIDLVVLGEYNHGIVCVAIIGFLMLYWGVREIRRFCKYAR